MGQDGDAVGVAYSPRGDFVASASTDGLGRVWRVANGRLIATLSGHGNYLTSVDFSTDGTQVVTASRDATARVFRAETGAPLAVLAGHTDRIPSADFVGDAGSMLVTASADGTARVWDALVQPELLVLSRFGGAVTDLGFVDERSVVAVTADGQSILDVVTGEPVDVGPLSRLVRSRLARSPSGATARIRGGTVVLRSGDRTMVLRGHRDDVTSVSFSSDGTRLVTASRDHDARIWDAASGRQLALLQGQFGVVNDARFSPDGRWVVTGGPRNAVLWNAGSGALVLRLRGHVGPVTAVAFDPSGRTIVTGGDDGTVRTYRCEICGGLDELIELAGERLAATKRELTDEERERYLG